MTAATSRFPRPAEHRDAELAVLVGGPSSGRWYWRPHLEVQIRAAEDAPRRGRSARAGEKALYQPTEVFVPHPEKPAESGREWRWTGEG